MFRLEIAGPGIGPFNRFINGEEAILGRDDDCDVVIEDSDVSRHHARLYRSDNGWVVEDLGSTNQIRVGEEVVARVLLADGQSFRLGSTEVAFHLLSAERASPAMTTPPEESAPVLPEAPVEEDAVVPAPTFEQRAAHTEAEGEDISADPAVQDATSPDDIEPPAAPEAEPEVREETAPASTDSNMAAMATPEPVREEGIATAVVSPDPPDPRRPSSPLDWLAGTGVTLAIVLQLCFGVGFVLWWRSMDLTRPPTPPPEEQVEPAPQPVDPGPSDPTTTEVVEVPEEPVDPSAGLTRGERMLQGARRSRADGDIYGAVQQIEKLLSMEPENRAALVELAELRAFKGEWVASRDMWQAVLALDPGPDLRAEAETELEKLAGRIRLEELAGGPSTATEVERRPMVDVVVPENATDTRPTEPEPPPVEAPRRDRVVIRKADLQILPGAQDRDEMRLLHVGVGARSAAYRVDANKIRVEARFFDRDGNSGRILPTTANLPDATQELTGGSLRINEPQEVTFAYVVPKGQRGRERVTNNLDLSYHGYVVEVFYDGQLQDRLAEPASLTDR